MQEVEGSTPTRGTCRNDFSDPLDQDIHTQWALSWKIVVSEWRSVIAVSLNVGGGVRLIKAAKLCMCTQNTTNTTRMDAWRRVCAAMVLYRWATRGTSLRELEYTHTHTSTQWFKWADGLFRISISIRHVKRHSFWSHCALPFHYKIVTKTKSFPWP